MDDREKIYEYVVHLARLGLTGRTQDVQSYAKRIIKQIGKSNEDLAARLAKTISDFPATGAVTRDATSSFVPIDSDSRLALLRQEFPVIMEDTPILTDEINSRLQQIIREREKISELAAKGLKPTRSILFSGPPGVGKTMSARWIAQRLDRPLLTLDLATVMSSYLGKTGSNIRAALDYAKDQNSILLLDELDAIAKKRDDEGDVGELKRLVTVLLQEIDDWPSTSLLIAATNHSELLDPAIWRRFDEVIQFPLPNKELRIATTKEAFGTDVVEIEALLPAIVDLWEGRSNSDIVRTANWVRRRVALGETTALDALLETIGGDLKRASAPDRKKMVSALSKLNLADRRISSVTGVSRDTLRKHRSTGKVSKNSRNLELD